MNKLKHRDNKEIAWDEAKSGMLAISKTGKPKYLVLENNSKHIKYFTFKMKKTCVVKRIDNTGFVWTNFDTLTSGSILIDAEGNSFIIT